MLLNVLLTKILTSSSSSSESYEDPNFDCANCKFDIDDVITISSDHIHETLEKLENISEELQNDSNSFTVKVENELKTIDEENLIVEKRYYVKEILTNLINECENYISLTNDLITFSEELHEFIYEPYCETYLKIKTVDGILKIFNGIKPDFMSCLDDLKNKLEETN